jgi:hypothetical protein
VVEASAFNSWSSIQAFGITVAGVVRCNRTMISHNNRSTSSGGHKSKLDAKLPVAAMVIVTFTSTVQQP